MKSTVIIGISSDIGKALAERYLQDGFTVVGTYRNQDMVSSLFGLPRLHLYHCDIQDPPSILNFMTNLARLNIKWDNFISCVGILTPIARFFDCNFDKWAESIQVNAIGQLRVLHSLYPYKNDKANVIFLAGGGTNNPFTNYSAYCVSKIVLIKMCELLDDENNDLNIFIVGPGWVKTKMHLQTLQNPKGAGGHYSETEEFLRASEGTSLDDIYNCITRLAACGQKVAGGRNFSVVHDDWRGEKLVAELLADKEMYKLRRHRNA